jgi:ribonuclease HI
MSDAPALTIYTDGAARGNPGPAAYAFIIEGGGQVIEEKGKLGSATNNVAEYTALVRALDKAAQIDGRRLMVHSDSELLVKQMNGEYRVKSDDLRPLYEQARQLARKFDHVTFKFIPRSQNSRADQLCNDALDEGRARPRGGLKGAGPSSQVPDPAADGMHQQAVECLQSAAAAWARGNPREPAPESVWEQLWSIVEEHGVLRRPRRR